MYCVIFFILKTKAFEKCCAMKLVRINQKAIKFKKVLLYFNHYFKYNYKWNSSYVFKTKLESNLDIRLQIMFMSRCKLKLHRRDPTADKGLRPEATWTCCAHSLCCDTAINWANSHSKILTLLDIGDLILFFSPQFYPLRAKYIVTENAID